jgi:hypothetical protein
MQDDSGGAAFWPWAIGLAVLLLVILFARLLTSS